MPSTDRTKMRYLERVNYFGQQVRLDVQGRILVPQILRESASMNGDVVVSGQLNHLVVWNHERFVSRLCRSSRSRRGLPCPQHPGI